ncbi:hypothetical protein [Rhodanobacter koreensis]
MRYWLLMGLAGFMVVTTARAVDEQPPSHQADTRNPAQVSVRQARQRVAQHQAEVKRLEQDVARQESDSKQASERLQQQDQAIAELQKQLEALHARPPASQH